MSWSPCPSLLALANLFRHSGDIHLNIGPLLILLNFVNCGNIDYVQHRDNVMKRQLQKELDPTNNVERDINKNTVHSCLQLKLFEQDVGLQICKTTKYVPTLQSNILWTDLELDRLCPPLRWLPPPLCHLPWLSAWRHGCYPACALRALGLLLADGTPTVGGGKTFWAVSRIFLRKQL